MCVALVGASGTPDDGEGVRQREGRRVRSAGACPGRRASAGSLASSARRPPPGRSRSPEQTRFPGGEGVAVGPVVTGGTEPGDVVRVAPRSAPSYWPDMVRFERAPTGPRSHADALARPSVPFPRRGPHTGPQAVLCLPTGGLLLELGLPTQPGAPPDRRALHRSGGRGRGEEPVIPLLPQVGESPAIPPLSGPSSRSGMTMCSGTSDRTGALSGYWVASVSKAWWRAIHHSACGASQLILCIPPARRP